MGKIDIPILKFVAMSPQDALALEA